MTRQGRKLRDKKTYSLIYLRRSKKTLRKDYSEKKKKLWSGRETNLNRRIMVSLKGLSLSLWMRGGDGKRSLTVISKGSKHRGRKSVQCLKTN
jgi:hypothetical protein